MIGLGQTQYGVPLGPQGVVPSYPTICNVPIISNWLDACKPLTQSQFVANATANLGPAASPSTVAAVQQAAAQTYQQQVSQAPDVQCAIDHPTLFSLFGATACQALGGVDWQSVLLGVAVVGLLVVMKR